MTHAELFEEDVHVQAALAVKEVDLLVETQALFVSGSEGNES